MMAGIELDVITICVLILAAAPIMTAVKSIRNWLDRMARHRASKQQ